MKSKYLTPSSHIFRRLCTVLALAAGMTATAIAVQATEQLSYQISLQTDSADRPAGGGGDGGDIIVFDIIDSVAKSERPAGGGGGQDIIVFDIIDSVARIYVRLEPSSTGFYQALLIEGERELPGWVSFEEVARGRFVLSFIF
jgi:hypothetical protein